MERMGIAGRVEDHEVGLHVALADLDQCRQSVSASTGSSMTWVLNGRHSEIFARLVAGSKMNVITVSRTSLQIV